MKKYVLPTLMFSLLTITLFGLTATPTLAAATAVLTTPWLYEFRIDGIVQETGNLNISSSPYWWVNSGGQMILQNGVGKTIQGDLPLISVWRNTYNVNNPVDTDNGTHPQNIFRLITRTHWLNAEEESRFKINHYNLSASPNREGHNGILLLSRYTDSDNLYYAGIRVDGNAIIKKKKNGTYYTLASRKIFNGTYNRSSNPNLLPTQQWMGLRVKTKNNVNGTVTIQLSIDRNNTNTWEMIAEATDDGRSFGGAALTGSGYGGIRSDFMDLEFDNFRLKTI